MLLVLTARNLWRNRLRTLLTVAGVAISIVAFVSLRTVLTAWTTAADSASKDRLATRHKISFTITIPKRYIEDVRAVPGIHQATHLNWFAGKNAKDSSQFIVSLAVDSESFLPVFDEIVLSDEDKHRWAEDRNGAIIGDVLAEQLGVKQGERFSLEGSIYPGTWEFTVSAIYGTKRRSIDRSTMFFHWSYLNESLPAEGRDQIGWIASRIDDPALGAAAAVAIDRVFDSKDVQTVTMSERAMQLSYLGMMSTMLKAIDLASKIVLLIVTLIMGNTIAMGVRERTREYAVLRALGFRPRHVRMFIIGEAVALGAVAGGLGLALSIPIVELGLGHWLEENMGAWFPYFRIEMTTYVFGFAAALALALVASALPAIRTARLPVTTALRRVA
jgi:putative ABC transport system permease protein